MHSSAEPPPGPKQARIREVVAQFVRESSNPEAVDEQTWTDRYPELMPELAEQLRFAPWSATPTGVNRMAPQRFPLTKVNSPFAAPTVRKSCGSRRMLAGVM